MENTEVIENVVENGEELVATAVDNGIMKQGVIIGGAVLGVGALVGLGYLIYKQAKKHVPNIIEDFKDRKEEKDAEKVEKNYVKIDEAE